MPIEPGIHEFVTAAVGERLPFGSSFGGDGSSAPNTGAYRTLTIRGERFTRIMWCSRHEMVLPGVNDVGRLYCAP